MSRLLPISILFRSQLCRISNNTTPLDGHYPFVVIDGRRYYVHSNTDDNNFRVLSVNIEKIFQSRVHCVVKLMTDSGHEISCFICFHDIPAIPRSHQFYPQPVPQMNFSVCMFKKELIDIRFATSKSTTSGTFALGCFNVQLFIQEFRNASMLECRIPILWKMLVDALRKIGYFDIYDYQDFQTTVFVLFQRMFFSRENYRFSREMFYSFVQRLLANNSWFLIVGESILQVRISPALIELFSDREYPPTMNFIDRDSGVVGITNQVGIGSDFRFVFRLVSFSTGQVREVGSLNQLDEPFEAIQEPNAILSCLFPPSCDDNNSDDFDNCFPLRRTPASPNTSCIREGVKPIGSLRLFVFKFGNTPYVFIERADGTFEPFNIYFFILSKMFAIDDEFKQLEYLFTNFSFVYVHHLIKGLLECGFQPIFDGTATIEQIRAFLLDSDFGQVLQELRQEFAFPRCPDSIRENRFIMDFNVIFRFLLENMRNRDDLTDEIQEILHFLGQLVEFLTIPPESK